MKPISVLIVDDDPSFRSLLGLYLRRSGFQVELADGAEDALKRLRQNHFHCLVTDGKMAPTDGFELARAARALHPSLRILMVSAVYEEKDIENTPIEKFFPKPVVTDQLVAWLSGNGSQGKTPL